MKKCSKCGDTKPMEIEFFQPRKENRDGFSGKCRKCMAEYNRKYRKKNIVAIKKHLKDNAVFIAAREKVKRGRPGKREIASENYKIYRVENKSAIAARNRIWAIENKEHVSKIRKVYIHNNLEKFRIYCHNRRSKIRSKIRSLPHTLIISQWKKIKMDFNEMCAYCGKSDKLTMEHFRPVTKLGEFTINNILPVCGSCNSSKQDEDFKTWYIKQDFYSKARESIVFKYLGYSNGIQQLSIM